MPFFPVLKEDIKRVWSIRGAARERDLQADDLRFPDSLLSDTLDRVTQIKNTVHQTP